MIEKTASNFIAHRPSNAEIYDPASGSFMLTGAYASTSYLTYATALLPDGRVSVVGVVDSAGTAGAARLFDPKTNTFSSTGQRGCFDCYIAWQQPTAGAEIDK